MLSSEFDGFSIGDITEYLQGIGVHIDTSGMPCPPPIVPKKADNSQAASDGTEHFAISGELQ